MPTTTTRPASSRPQSDFARSAVFTEFSGRDARALDQADFVDRDPEQLSRLHTEADASGEIAVDRIAHALRQVGDDVESQTAGV